MLTIWIVWSTRDGVLWTREDPVIDPNELEYLVEQNRALRRRVYTQVVHAPQPEVRLMDKEAT